MQCIYTYIKTKMPTHLESALRLPNINVEASQNDRRLKQLSNYVLELLTIEYVIHIKHNLKDILESFETLNQKSTVNQRSTVGSTTLHTRSERSVTQISDL